MSFCAACGSSLPDEATFCSRCGASLEAQARDSVALERLQSALADRYPIERRLGEGGMATVYLARDAKHSRQVALKVIRPEVAYALGAERFLREIAVAASLQHPHILPLLDSGQALGPGDSAPVLFYVMPYVPGGTLRERLERETQLPLDEAVRIAQEVAGALDHAHRQGVVHRDIKPENIMLSEGHALVTDFGIARAAGASGARLTETGMALGTPMYMSPEQSSGEREVDGRSDIYSLGSVLYEMLAGEPPYTGPTVQSIIAKRFSEPVPQLRTVREVPEAIDAVVRRALARVPADRFATAADMAAALSAQRPSWTGTAPASRPEFSAALPRLSRRWLVLGAVLLVAALLLGRFIWRGAGGERVALSSSMVAVFPFAAHGGPGARDLGGALVPLLSTVLGGVGDLRTVDPSAVLAATGEGAGAAPDPERARAIARRLGAGRYVIGDVVEGAAGQYSITATAYDAAGGAARARRATVEGSAQGGEFRLVNDLAVQLLSAFGISEPPRRLESISTSSIVALNEYLRGEAALRHGVYDSAATAFGRAVAADSLFALAWFRQAYAYASTETPEKAEYPMARALALQSRLSAHDQRLAKALSAEVQVRPEEAERLYRAIVYDYPDDVEGWFGLGDVRLHFGPLYGIPMDSLSDAFKRVLFLDPNHREALYHLPWAAGLDGRIALVDSATKRALASDTGGYFSVVWRVLGAFARGDTAAETRSLSQPAMDDLQRLLAVSFVATLKDPGAAERAATALLAAPGRLPEVRAFGHVMVAYLELARGRARAAAAQIAAADSLGPAIALEGGALLALWPLDDSVDAAASGAALRTLRARVERWNAAAVPPSLNGNAWVSPHDSLHEQIRLYLLGALSARLGDEAAARRYAGTLERFDTTTAQGVIGRAMAHQVLGDQALLGGRPEQGLGELDRSGLRGPYARTWERAFSSPFFSQAYERYLRARALSALGRGTEALRWYHSLWMATVFDQIYLAPSELGQAEIYDRQGERAPALAHYRAFVNLWRDADPALQPMVRKAQARITALQ